MTTNVIELFQRRSDAEIIKITPQKREEIIRQAKSFVCEKFASKFALDGCELSGINSAIAQSLLEGFVRSKAEEEKTGAMLKIDLSIYESALDSLRDFINQKFANFDLLQAFWLEQAKVCASSTFAQSKKVFRTYLMGDLCENLYIDIETADAVIEELKRVKFLKTDGKQHHCELLVRTSNE